MINEKTINGLRVYYANVHPLIFHRSAERAKSGGHLFDILKSLENIVYPIIWHEEKQEWTTTNNLFQSKEA